MSASLSADFTSAFSGRPSHEFLLWWHFLHRLDVLIVEPIVSGVEFLNGTTVEHLHDAISSSDEFPLFSGIFSAFVFAISPNVSLHDINCLFMCT